MDDATRPHEDEGDNGVSKEDDDSDLTTTTTSTPKEKEMRTVRRSAEIAGQGLMINRTRMNGEFAITLDEHVLPATKHTELQVNINGVPDALASNPLKTWAFEDSRKTPLQDVIGQIASPLQDVVDKGSMSPSEEQVRGSEDLVVKTEESSSNNSKPEVMCSKADDADLYFVIGCSLSCKEEEGWNAVKVWVADIVNGFHLADDLVQVRIVQWSSEDPTVICDSLADGPNFFKCLQGIQKGTGHGHIDKALELVSNDIAQRRVQTQIYQGLIEMGINRKLSQGKDRKQKIFVLVDEMNHLEETLEQAQNLANVASCMEFMEQKQCITSVSFGNDQVMGREIKQLASDPHSRNFFVAETHEDLQNTVGTLLSQICGESEDADGYEIHGEPGQEPEGA